MVMQADLIRRGDYGNAGGNCIHTSCLKSFVGRVSNLSFSKLQQRSYNKDPYLLSKSRNKLAR